MRLTAFSVFESHKHLILAGFFGIGLGILTLISPWLGLAGLVSVLSVILVLSRPIYLCYGMILATVFGSGMSRGQLIPYFIPNEVVLLLGTALAFPVLLINRRRRVSDSGLLVTGLVIVASGTSVFPFLIYLSRGISLSVSEMFSLLAPLQYVLIYLIFRYLPANEKEVRTILRLMLLCAAVVGVIGLLQAMRVGIVLNVLSTWYKSSHQETALAYGRVSSVLGAWNSLGTFLMLNLLILRAMSVVKPTLMSRSIFLLIATSCAGCLIASGSYASLIGLFVGLFLFEIFDARGRTTTVIFFICVAMLGIILRDNVLGRFAFQYRSGGVIPQTLVFRFAVWKDVFWPIIRETWLWGFRPVIPSTVSWGYAESQYFTLLIRSGIFSFLAHLLWIGLTLVWLHRNINTTDDLRHFLAIGAFILFIVLSLMGLTNAVFNYSGVIEYLWILLGLIGVLGENKIKPALEIGEVL
jgi:hypothetical protein